MIATTTSVALATLYGTPITVECSITDGIGIHLVGLADIAEKESLLRTVTALQANGYRIPGKKIVINFAPADLRKSEGCRYDLAVALALLEASGQASLPDLGNWMIAGELALDGQLRDVTGCVQAVIQARKNGLKGVIVPTGNLFEMYEFLDGDDSIPVYAAKDLTDAIGIIQNPEGHERVVNSHDALVRETATKPKAGDAFCQLEHPFLRRTALIAAAGGHGVLATRSNAKAYLLAKAISELLPPLGKEDRLRVAAIYSMSGHAIRKDAVPFRTPSQGSSLAALAGGGTGENVLPGEVSLTHAGVLEMDVSLIGPKRNLELLLAAIHDKKVVISRLRSKTEFPADFLPVISVDEKDNDTMAAVIGHMGPLADNLDMQVFLSNIGHPDSDVSFEDARERVRAAREKQRNRYGYKVTNADVARTLLEVEGQFPENTIQTVDILCERLNLSARAYGRILRIARTIADLEGSEEVLPKHVSEASCYRFLDRFSIE